MATMIRSQTRRRQLAASFVAAVAVHIALVVWLFFLRPGSPSLDEVPPQAAAGHGADPTAETAGESIPSDRAELRGKIDLTVNRFLGGDPEKLTERAEGAAQWIESRSSEDSIDDIGKVVRDAYEVRPRAYAPVNPAPPGEFDHGTMLPYAVKHLVSEDGSKRVAYTWVDEQGRSLEIEMLEEASDPALTTALQLAERSPMMRQLFQTSILPVLESQLRQRH